MTIRITGSQKNAAGFWLPETTLELLEGMIGGKKILSVIANERMRELNSDQDTFARKFSIEKSY